MTAKRMKKPATKPAKKQSSEPLAYIHESLRPLAEPIDSLIPNPDNPVKHDEAAIAATMKSLEGFDMRGVVVVRESDRMIVDGHCRYEAAQRLGWTHLPVIFVDDTKAEAITYALASRATVELSAWHDELLAAALATAHQFDADLFDVLGLEALCEQAGTAMGGENLPPEVAVTESWQVVVECRDEVHQQEIYEGLTEAGHNCKCLTI